MEHSIKNRYLKFLILKNCGKLKKIFLKFRFMIKDLLFLKIFITFLFQDYHLFVMISLIIIIIIEIIIEFNSMRIKSISYFLLLSNIFLFLYIILMIHEYFNIEITIILKDILYLISNILKTL